MGCADPVVLPTFHVGLWIQVRFDSEAEQRFLLETEFPTLNELLALVILITQCFKLTVDDIC